MNSNKLVEVNSNSAEATLQIATAVGRNLKGGEVVELVGDLGTGKTVFVRGLATGVESQDHVQSPSFTISRTYKGPDGREIHHYDFHRLDDPGLLKQELAESLSHPKASVAVEWADRVAGILPKEKLVITLQPTGEETRTLKFKATKKLQYLLKGIGQ